jgi:predicted anti-sigma-YlaC factor YlaD
MEHPTRDLIEDFAFDALDLHTAHGVADHLRACSRCRRLVDAMTGLLSGLRDVNDHPVHVSDSTAAR